jgi:hypothetical protein
MYYIADILHNLLRVVPQIFLHTVQENCDEEELKQVGQWCYENLSLIISDDIYLHTEKGVKKLNVSAESWPGSTCRLLLDNYDTILKIAIKDHGNGELNEDVYAEALAVWEAFFLFMRRAIEHAITNAQSTAPHTPSATILILPRWEHTPYWHYSKYINSPYTHHLYTLPNDANTFLPPDQHTCSVHDSCLPLPRLGTSQRLLV